MAAARWIAPPEVDPPTPPPPGETDSGKRAPQAVAAYRASVLEPAFLDRRPYGPMRTTGTT
ncbi:hypothetical protein [Amycolatopsis mediterranei]|uniref:Uncharacterized protein n=1 Tax=Amycolatopsis mediterranei (strain S699) TaxID=713604 RepID=A0A9R0NV63_AMYMS|nr:hypothetical protein [Amycolatopsis mediterranei]AEK41232.1 hypothetical protein RAM_13720 [Amycolatopsis mediterranei S699]KDO07149.1 hypothetical protein DV26_30820 [Amycolatopsis mediterranei]KDU92502.1 hypothetical protein DV36_11235 [Amycolatopsis mediterranei]UZF69678.1 hypothetical protein ISP_002842 [Amycolatopsis mediterranei]